MAADKTDGPEYAKGALSYEERVRVLAAGPVLVLLRTATPDVALDIAKEVVRQLEEIIAQHNAPIDRKDR
jgi:hypothetical protein